MMSAETGPDGARTRLPLVEAELIDRIRWFIALRFFAVGGVFVALILVEAFLRFSLPYTRLHLINVFILIYNIFFFLVTRYLQQSAEPRGLVWNANALANLQMSLDLTSLAFLLHYSGGIENPFIFYFIFHMIIASILLSARASFLQATLGTGLLASVVAFEYFGILAHWPLPFSKDPGLYTNRVFVLAVMFVFVTTLYLSVYMASSISKRLRQRTAQLVRANELLEERDMVKNEYVLRVSHDIRAHLSAIQSCLSPVLSGLTGDVNPARRDLLRRAHLRTDKLLFFVKALLRLSSFRLKRELNIAKFSLEDLIRKAVESVSLKAASRTISVSVNCEKGLPPIEAEGESIEAVIGDLIANSVKYTPPGGKITVSAEEEGPVLRVTVTDTGIGIGPEDLKKVFGEFYRGSNAREVEPQGTGLGLTIARLIIERHGGEIWAESPGIGKGTTVTFTLPKRYTSRASA